MKRSKAILMMAAFATGAAAQAPIPHEATACPESPAPLPPELAGWTAAAPLTAANDRPGLTHALIEIDKGAEVALAPTPEVRYPLRPEKPGGTVSHGGLLGFSIPARGTYRVALSSAAWIDVVRDGKAVESTAHGPGPACTGLRKIVDFPLEPGRYVLQIAASGPPAIRVMIVRHP